jgi:hypothetical protein
MIGLFAAFFHVVVGGLIAVQRGIAPSKRMLALAMAVCIPVFGPALALGALTLRGRGTVKGFGAAPGTTRELPITAGDVSRMGQELPIIERLTSRDPEERSAALAGLSHLADADSIKLLRWAANQDDPDLVLEATLTLHELTGRHEEERERLCEQANRRPSFDHAVAAADAYARVILSTLADVDLLPQYAQRARHYYDLAETCAPERRSELRLARARLELAAGQAEAACELLDGDWTDASPEERRERDLLRRDAAFAARRFRALPVPGDSDDPGGVSHER